MKGVTVGSSGAFLETGGFKEQGWEATGKKTHGIKVIKKIIISKKDKQSLPLFSNTPGTAYILLDENGKFNIFRQYGEDRKALFDIEYGEHQHVLSLHIHRFDADGIREIDPDIIAYDKNHIVDNYMLRYHNVIVDEKLYNKYKKFLKETDFYDR